jgi:hypothetical protein
MQIRERPNDDRIHKAEDCGLRPDTQRECQNGEDAYSRRRVQGSNWMANRELDFHVDRH